MFAAAPALGGHPAYEGPHRLDARQRMLAIVVVLGLHVAVISGFMIAQLRTPAPPPEKTLSVTLITENAAPAPTPPQPPQPEPPPPEPRLMATPRPTPSPMTAPPMEKEPQRPTTQPAPPAPPAPAAPSSAAPTAAAVTPPNFTAAYLNNPGPVYPVAARRRHDEGTVRLRVQVSPEGAPLQVTVDRSSGHPELDAAALDVVRKRWRFVPAKQGEHAVSAWVIVPMEFSLKTR